MSDTMRISWDAVAQLHCIEFLNVICYIKDKRAFEAEELKRWQKTH